MSNLQGDIQGQVVMGDVIHNAPVISICCDQFESQKQWQFKKKTNINCGRQPREIFERLMSEYGFRAKDLYLAWHYGVISWDEPERSLRIKPKRFEYFTMGWGLALLCASMMILAIVVLMLVPMQAPASAQVGVQFGSYLFGAWIASRVILTPYNTGQRVQKVLNACPSILGKAADSIDT